MLKRIWLLLGVGMNAWACWAGTPAAEGVDLSAVALARGKAEMALQGFEPYNRDTDDHNGGWSQLWYKIDNTHANLIDILNAELQKENNSQAEIKNTARIEDLQKKIQESDRAYNIVRNQTANIMGNSLNVLRAQHGALKNGFEQFSGPEQQLKSAKNDLAPIKNLYAAIEKRSLELQAQAKEIIDSLAKLAKEWEDKTAAAKAFFAPKAAEKQF
jgi:hypothetical protein